MLRQPTLSLTYAAPGNWQEQVLPDVAFGALAMSVQFAGPPLPVLKQGKDIQALRSRGSRQVVTGMQDNNGQQQQQQQRKHKNHVPATPDRCACVDLQMLCHGSRQQ